MSAQGRSEIRRLLAEHDLRPRRRLGQHFLADPNVVDRIIRLSGAGPGAQVVEIGAGTGTLTMGLVASGATVVSYEVDQRLRPLLEAVTADAPVDLRFADALEVDFDVALGPGDWSMIANLPYGIGTRLILETLRTAPRVSRLVVMVQREVADRLVAAPGSKTYGLATVIATLYGTVRFGFGVGPSVFLPPPDVDSAVVVVDRVEPHPLATEAARLAAAAFGQRRKMLRRSLAGVLGDAAGSLAAAGIDETARAETLAASDYLRLAVVVS